MSTSTPGQGRRTSAAAKRKTTRQQKAEPIGDDGLTDKQRVFIEEYLTCWNASEAARRAGYSPKTAGQIGAENLKKLEIRQAVDRRLAEKRMSADEVLARLTAQASADMDDFLTKSGRGVKLDLAKAKTAGRLHLVRKYNKTKQGTSIELYDAQAALVQLGRYHKLFTDKISGDLTNTVTTVTSDELAKAKAEAEKWERERFDDGA